MKTISLCMIIKNEEEVIERCLTSVRDIADEIIIVDTGSTDKSKEIAVRFSDKIFDFEWVDDFSKARNFAFSKATQDYIMWLDADDIIKEEDYQKIMKLKSEIADEDVFMLKYHTGFDEFDKPTLSFYRERILKRSNNYQWVGAIHEVITVTGKVKYSDAAVSHKKVRHGQSNRNLLIYQSLLAKNEKFSARDLFYYSRELYYNGLYQDATVNFEKFLLDKRGWKENKINACVDLAKCYLAINQKDNALISLLKSFAYDLPRADTLVELGHYFFTEKDYLKAIYWYELATTIPFDLENGGFANFDCHNFLPYIQLVVCYDRIGNSEKAIYYNGKAEEYKPNHPSVLYNNNYFKSILKDKK